MVLYYQILIFVLFFGLYHQLILAESQDKLLMHATIALCVMKSSKL